MPLSPSTLVPTITDLHLLQCAITDQAFYAMLLLELPGPEVEVRAAIQTAGEPIELSGVQIRATDDGGAGLWADDVTWIGATATSVAGVGIFRKVGLSPSTSDPLFSVVAFVDAAGLTCPIDFAADNFTASLSTTPFFLTRG
ncbi:MAG: hypothetical protein ACHWZW_03055 [Spirulina sp.]